MGVLALIYHAVLYVKCTDTIVPVMNMCVSWVAYQKVSRDSYRGLHGGGSVDFSLSHQAGVFLNLVHD